MADDITEGLAKTLEEHPGVLAATALQIQLRTETEASLYTQVLTATNLVVLEDVLKDQATAAVRTLAKTNPHLITPRLLKRHPEFEDFLEERS